MLITDLSLPVRHKSIPKYFSPLDKLLDERVSLYAPLSEVDLS